MAHNNGICKSVTTFQWQIENFSFWHQQIHGRKLMSPQFECTSFKGNNLCLVLFPNGFDDEDEYLRVRLYPIQLLVPETLDCEVSILGSNRLPLVTLVESNTLMNQEMPLDLPPGPPFLEVFVTQKSLFLPRDTLTLQCQVKRSDGVGEVCEYYFARTRIEIRETTFMWPKKCFINLELEKSVTIFPLLTLFPQDFVKFSCKQTLKGPSLEDSRLVLEIGEVGCNEKMLLKCKLSLLDSSMKTVTFTEDNCMFGFLSSDRTWSVPGFLREQLLAKSIHTLSLTIVIATLHKSDTIERTFRTPRFSKYRFPQSYSSRNQLQKGPYESDAILYKIDSTTALVESLFNMYLDHTLSDFEVQSGGTSFPVHKNILCIRSSVFRALIMDKNECNSMKVNDLDVSTLSSMLRFIYGGSLGILEWKSAVKLYHAAHTYQISSLQKECFCFLQYSIDVSNVCEILKLADRHNDEELLSIANGFVCENMHEVMLSEGWGELIESDSDLAAEAVKMFWDRYS